MWRVVATLMLITALHAKDNETSAEVDDDGDSAPFMVTVEKDSGVRCTGSLVSVRMVLTSAWCARGRPTWVLAGGGGGARQVRRIAIARGAAAESGSADLNAAAVGAAWGGALLDLAVLELESPFPQSSRARSILMATDASDCEAAHTVCHIASLQMAPRASVRIVDATVAESVVCSARARFWASVRERALCLVGPLLCPTDWGAGVVCGGKLCGVVSRSTGVGSSEGIEIQSGCGDTHAVQSVARWRQFLHCAVNMHMCGRDNCAEICLESHSNSDEDAEPSSTRETTKSADYSSSPQFSARVLHKQPTMSQFSPNAVDDDDEDEVVTSRRQVLVQDKANDKIDGVLSTTEVINTQTQRKQKMYKQSQAMETTKAAHKKIKNPSETRTTHNRPTRSTFGFLYVEAPVRPTGGGAAEFEPNRADFRAGEYGDTVVEYGAHDDIVGGGSVLKDLSDNSVGITVGGVSGSGGTSTPPTRTGEPFVYSREYQSSSQQAASPRSFHASKHSQWSSGEPLTPPPPPSPEPRRLVSIDNSTRLKSSAATPLHSSYAIYFIYLQVLNMVFEYTFDDLRFIFLNKLCIGW